MMAMNVLVLIVVVSLLVHVSEAFSLISTKPSVRSSICRVARSHQPVELLRSSDLNRNIRLQALNMMTTETSPAIDVYAKNIEITPSLQDRVTSKLGKVLAKLGRNAISANVVLRVHSLPPTESHTQTTKKNSQIAEMTVRLKGGQVVHVTEHSEDMYASIDMAAHRMAKTLRRHHEKMIDKRRRDRGALVPDPAEEAESIVFDEDELIKDLQTKFQDNLKPVGTKPLTVVRPKKFPMPAITVDAALEALETIDHPFYVFRNVDTNEINVIYRRDTGGAGLIMPE